MSEIEERSDDQASEPSLVLLADKLLREPEIVAWLGGGRGDDDDEPRAA